MRPEITEFRLWRDEKGFRGYAKYHGLKKYECRIRNGTVLVKVNDRWTRFGRFYDRKPEKVRADKEYECVGIIWTPDYTYHVLKDRDGFLAI